MSAGKAVDDYGIYISIHGSQLESYNGCQTGSADLSSSTEIRTSEVQCGFSNEPEVFPTCQMLFDAVVHHEKLIFSLGFTHPLVFRLDESDHTN